jgi:hypothetical protein
VVVEEELRVAAAVAVFGGRQKRRGEGVGGEGASQHPTAGCSRRCCCCRCLYYCWCLVPCRWVTG